MVETTNSLSADPRLYGPLKALSEKEALTQYGEAATCPGGGHLWVIRL
jgi:hypothetical protein